MVGVIVVHAFRAAAKNLQIETSPHEGHNTIKMSLSREQESNIMAPQPLRTRFDSDVGTGTGGFCSPAVFA